MAGLLRYFRQHPWQRRSLTLLLALAGGLAVAYVAYPIIDQHLVIRALGSADPAERTAALNRAIVLASRDPGFVRRLEDALDSPDDRTFRGVVTALRWAGRFETPDRDPIHVDRMRAIELADTSDADVRRRMLFPAVAATRDNRHIRQTLALAAGDESPPVRSAACVLAARLGDADTLARLMGDPDSDVRAAAAMDAGLAGMSELTDSLAGLFDADEPPVAASAALALAKLEPEDWSERICRRLVETGSDDLRDRLCHVAIVLNDAEARRAVGEIIRRTGEDAVPPAMAILACGRLGVREVGPHVAAGLTAALEGREVTGGQLLAMLDATGRLRLPVRREVYDLCERLWNPQRYQLVLMRAATLLGEQAELPQDDPDAPTREECVELLRLLATYGAEVTTQPVDGEGTRIVWATPVPSAAAATALWQLEPSSSIFRTPPQRSAPGEWMLEIDSTGSAFQVRQIAGAAPALAGDFIAWRLGRSGRPEAFELAMEMLPPPLDPNVPLERQPLRVYNPNERSAGAMMMALAARTPEQRKAAAERIGARLTGSVFGPETDFFVVGSLRCALLILGRDDAVGTVRELLRTPEFPTRRAFTALCADGRTWGLDWLLWNPQMTRADVAYVLTAKAVNEVLQAAAPALGRVDACADRGVQLWQVRALQDEFILTRDSLSVGLAPTTQPSGR